MPPGNCAVENFGPLKHHLTTRTTTLTDLLGEDLPQSEENAATKLEEPHEAQENVKVSLRKFVEKHEAWTSILDAIEDDQVQTTELEYYDAVCDEYTSLIFNLKIIPIYFFLFFFYFIYFILFIF